MRLLGYSLLLFSIVSVSSKCVKTYRKNGLKMTPDYPGNFYGNCTFNFPPKKGKSIKFTVTGDNTEGDEIYATFSNKSITPILISRGHQQASTVYSPEGMGLKMVFSKPRAVLVSNYEPEENGIQPANSRQGTQIPSTSLKWMDKEWRSATRFDKYWYARTFRLGSIMESKLMNYTPTASRKKHSNYGNCTFNFPPKKGKSIKFTVTGDNTEGDEIYATFSNKSITPILISRGHQQASTVYSPEGMGLKMVFSKPRAVLVSNYEPDKEPKQCPSPIININNASIQLNLKTIPKTGCAFRFVSDKKISMALNCVVAHVYHPGNSTRQLISDPSDSKENLILDPNVDVLLIPNNQLGCSNRYAVLFSAPVETSDPCDRGTTNLEIKYNNATQFWFSDSVKIYYEEAIFPPKLFTTCPKITARYNVTCTDCRKYSEAGKYFGLTAEIAPGEYCEIAISNKTAEIIRLTSISAVGSYNTFIPGEKFQIEMKCKQPPPKKPSIFAGMLPDGFLKLVKKSGEKRVSMSFEKTFKDCACPPITLSDSTKTYSYTSVPHCSTKPVGLLCYTQLLPKNKKRKVEISYNFLDEEDSLWVLSAEGFHRLAAYTEDQWFAVKKSILRDEHLQFEQPLDRQYKHLSLILPPNEEIHFTFRREKAEIFKDGKRFPGTFNITWHDVDD